MAISSWYVLRMISWISAVVLLVELCDSQIDFSTAYFCFFIGSEKYISPRVVFAKYPLKDFFEEIIQLLFQIKS